MARDKNRPIRNHEDPTQQEEMTVVILRFNGTGDTLRKGFDAVSQALAALAPTAQRPQRGNIAPRVAPKEIEPGDSNGAAHGEATDVEYEDVSEQESEEAPAPRTTKAGNGTRKYTAPSFDSSLDLSGGGVTSLKDFCAHRSPQNENEKYLLACAWLMKHGGCETFSVDQVFTCFRAMGWREQKDFSQPLRLLKSKKSYFDIPAKGQWKPNAHGMSAADAIA
jgi:hypothetical protein